MDGPRQPNRKRSPEPLECRTCGCRHFYLVEAFAAAPGRMRVKRQCRHCGRLVIRIEDVEGNAVGKGPWGLGARG